MRVIAEQGQTITTLNKRLDTAMAGFDPTQNVVTDYFTMHQVLEDEGALVKRRGLSIRCSYKLRRWCLTNKLRSPSARAAKQGRQGQAQASDVPLSLPLRCGEKMAWRRGQRHHQSPQRQSHRPGRAHAGPGKAEEPTCRALPAGRRLTAQGEPLHQVKEHPVLGPAVALKRDGWSRWEGRKMVVPTASGREEAVAPGGGEGVNGGAARRRETSRQRPSFLRQARPARRPRSSSRASDDSRQRYLVFDHTFLGDLHGRYRNADGDEPMIASTRTAPKGGRETLPPLI
jgi:hypothetical protein